MLFSGRAKSTPKTIKPTTETQRSRATTKENPRRRHGENHASNSSQLSANLGVSNTVRSRTNCFKRGDAEARRKMRWETGSRQSRMRSPRLFLRASAPPRFGTSCSISVSICPPGCVARIWKSYGRRKSRQKFARKKKNSKLQTHPPRKEPSQWELTGFVEDLKITKDLNCYWSIPDMDCSCWSYLKSPPFHR